MGFAASQSRLISLVARKSDLELEAQLIHQHRLYLSNMVTGLFTMQARLDPNEAAAKILDARIRQLQQADKVLEVHLNRINGQREAIVTEIDPVRKMISDNIKGSFGLLGGR